MSPLPQFLPFTFDPTVETLPTVIFPGFTTITLPTLTIPGEFSIPFQFPPTITRDPFSIESVSTSHAHDNTPITSTISSTTNMPFTSSTSGTISTPMTSFSSGTTSAATSTRNMTPSSGLGKMSDSQDNGNSGRSHGTTIIVIGSISGITGFLLISVCVLIFRRRRRARRKASDNGASDPRPYTLPIQDISYPIGIVSGNRPMDPKGYDMNAVEATMLSYNGSTIQGKNILGGTKTTERFITARERVRQLENLDNNTENDATLNEINRMLDELESKVPPPDYVSHYRRSPSSQNTNFGTR